MKLTAIVAAAIAILVTIGAMALSASSASANSQSENPSGISAEICGDAVCVYWTPGTADYTFQQVLIWEGVSRPDGGAIATMGADEEDSVRIPMNYMRLIPLKEEHGDNITFSFRAMAVEMGIQGVIYTGYSEKVTLQIPRTLLYD